MTPVEQIKERLDLVEIIQEYVPLKKLGTNFKGLCPFHNEKSPSFSVSQERQFFYCFGCAKGGDIFQFIQDIEHVDFPEALRLLAARAGVELEYESKQDRTQRAADRDCLALATKFFQATFHQSTEAQIAREYVQGRGLADQTIADWQLGYSSAQWDALYQFLLKKGYSAQVMEEVGLVSRSQKTGKLYDRFRGRVMFPICDTHGSVIGFTARTLDPNEPAGKYVNTPSTTLYNKSAVLYGLHRAKSAIAAANVAVLVEGNMDVITAHQAGITNVVAVSGTALTADQVRLLKRYTDTVIIAFDGDAAGIRAVWRGMSVAVAAGLNLRILKLPAGQDPDDVITADPSVFQRLMMDAQPLLDYAMQMILSPQSATDPQQKKQAAHELLPMIAWLPDQIEQQHYLQQLADRLGVPVTVLQEELQRLPPSPLKGYGGQGQPVSATVTPIPEATDHATQLIMRLMALCLLDRGVWDRLDHQLLVTMLTTPEARALYNSLQSFYNTSSQPGSLPTVLESFSIQADDWYGSLSSDQRTREYTSVWTQLQRDWIHTQIVAIQQALQATEGSGSSDADVLALTQQFQALTERLKKLEIAETV